MGNLEERIKKIKSISAYSLPDNTADAKLTTEQIKKKFYEPLIYLLQIVNEVETLLVATDNVSQENAREILALKLRVQEALTQVSEVISIAEQTRKDLISGDLAVVSYVTNDGYTEKISDMAVRISNEIETLTNDISNLTNYSAQLNIRIEEALQEAKEYTDQKAVKMYKAKGSVSYYYQLPTENQEGDVYNIVNADPDHDIDAGDNVVWTDKGTWDKLGGNYDHKPIFDNINYIGTGGIKAVSSYDNDTGEVELEIFDFVNPSYNETTGVLEINAELKELN